MINMVDSNVVAQSMAPIQAPRIKSIASKDIQVFLSQRRTYEDAIEAIPGLNPVPYRSCFDGLYLDSLIEIEFFGEEVEELKDLTDAIVKAKLEESIGVKTDVSYDDALSIVKKQIRLDVNESDAERRIIMLNAAYVTLSRKHGWTFRKDAPKAAIRHLVAVLQPPVLKKKIEEAVELDKNGIKYDYRKFISYLKKKAAACEEFNPLREYVKNSGTERSKFGGKRREDTIPKPSSGHDSKNLSNSESQGGSRSTDPPKRKLPPCLVHGCKEKHYVKDHPGISAEEAKRLVTEYKNKKAKDMGKSKMNPPAKASAVHSDEVQPAVIQAKLGGFQFNCRLDTGNDVTATISDTIVNFLGEKGGMLPFRPMTSNLTSVDGKKLAVLGEVMICPLLQTAAGPCRIRNVRVMVIKDADTYCKPGNDAPGEISLGNPFFKKAGLDMEDFVALHKNLLESIDFDECPELAKPGKVGKIGRKLMAASYASSSTKPMKSASVMDYTNLPLSDGDDIDYKDVDIGDLDEAELQKSIDNMVDRVSSVFDSKDLDCLVSSKHDLQTLVNEFKDIFRIRLGNDPPVDVPPMKIEFDRPERPVKVRQRTYSPKQLTFLKNKVSELMKAGFIQKNNSSKWACAPLVVPKPGSKEGFRFTVDLRPINAQSKKNVWPMPNADAMLAKLAGSKVWFKLDCLHGYWQFPLEENSRECQSFHTPDGVYTPTRVLHGASNAVSYFQSSMESLFGHLELLIYLDDILGYASTVAELISKLRSVFCICRKRGLKLSPDKCNLVTEEVPFCGRIINKDGVRFCPRQYEALTSMQAPTTVGALMELVHGANWMRTAIPEFSRLIAPLHDLLESNYSLNKTRKKTRLANRPISAWADEHADAFQCLIMAIKEQATLATVDPLKRLCLFTDASEPNWSGVLTQVGYTEFLMGSPPQEWNHQPIAFVSGSFRGSSARWTMPEKESYAIIQSVIRLAHILVAANEFSVFTDHKNILFMFAPHKFNTNVARHVVHKVQRWAIRLSEFNFTVEHIPGVDNVWADMLTRWAAPDYAKFPARKIGALRIPLITEDKPELPSIDVIAASQKKFPPSESVCLAYSKLTRKSSQGIELELWVSKDGQLYIPAEDEELQLRIMVAAHCGLGGHRGYTTTCNIIKEKVVWDTIDEDVKAFVQSCLVCMLSESGIKVPRPLGQQIHSSKVGEILHFDYLYIGESSDGTEYILILKDDFSGYVFLQACKHADAATTAEVLMKYFTTFVPVLTWFSDQGTHFKNEVIELLAKSLGAKHHFSTAYVPWSNGTVESVCKQVLRVLRAFSAEFDVPEAEWSSAVPSIQSIINNSPSRRLGNRAPVTVHTGMDPGNPLHLALSSICYDDAESVDEAKTTQLLSIQDLHSALDKMHKEVDETLSNERRKAIERHNAKTHIRPCTISIGDYVVVARYHGPRTKMSANWVGPRRVIQVMSDFTFKVEHLVSQETEVVHVSRIKHYADALIGSKVQMEKLAERTDKIWYSVDDIKDVKKRNDEFQVLVSWKGLSSKGDTWEPLQAMFEDVPSKVRAFFKRKRKTAALSAAMKSLRL